jgi:transcriptional regulator with XRE-family HTH domain
MSKAGAEVEAQLVSVGRALAQRRAESGLSLRLLAGMTDLSAAGISRLENGERTPTLRSVIMLSRALKLTVTIDKGEVTVS